MRQEYPKKLNGIQNQKKDFKMKENLLQKIIILLLIQVIIINLLLCKFLMKSKWKIPSIYKEILKWKNI